MENSSSSGPMEYGPPNSDPTMPQDGPGGDGDGDAPSSFTRRYPVQPSYPTGGPTASARRYRMESDIFGTGMNPANPHTHTMGGLGPGSQRGSGGTTSRMDVAAGLPSPPINDMRNPVLGRGMDEEHYGEVRFDEDNRAGGNKRNARENGGNPLTGEGYGEEDKCQSQRRQFGGYKSTPLW